jgi:hypothetical protein
MFSLDPENFDRLPKAYKLLSLTFAEFRLDFFMIVFFLSGFSGVELISIGSW